ncbi:MAG: hypothetical protein EB015_07980 [Methylocystaceae bacterium]|nr:hypothetical protein [Methylocystaceae bacterium]
MNDKNFSLLVLGEALIDLVQQADGTFLPLLGGSPYNLCCAAAMQGAEVGYFNPFSSDTFGRSLLSCLVKAGGQPLSRASAYPTSLSIVTLNNGQPSYGFYREGIADRDYCVGTLLSFLEHHPPAVLHTGSLMLIPPDHEKLIPILEHAKNRGWIISVDLNARPKIAKDLDAYRDALWLVTNYADWLKASDEDLQFMGFENTAIDNAEQISQVFQAKGCQRIALTFGAKGAYLQVGDVCGFGDAPKIEVVDTIGAGDVFWATCLVDWMSDLGCFQTQSLLENTLDRALRAAAITCTRAGCAPPNADEL